MKDGENRKERLPGLWKTIGKYKYVLIVIAAGVVLLMLPKGRESGQTSASAGTGFAAAEGFDLEALERNMESALSQIDGAGEVTVVLTLKGSARRVLAEDSRSSGEDASTETVVVSQGSGTENGILIQEIYPQFQGALVVCSGGSDAAVRLKILDSVAALTGLSSNHISVCTGRK